MDEEGDSSTGKSDGDHGSEYTCPPHNTNYPCVSIMYLEGWSLVYFVRLYLADRFGFEFEPLVSFSDMSEIHPVENVRKKGNLNVAPGHSIDESVGKPY